MALEITPAIDERLTSEQIIWITSVRADGLPQPTPVWYLWHDQNVLIFSMPGAQKLRNIQQHPQIALNLNTDATGGQVLVITGEARISTDPVSQPLMDAYLAKYAEGIKSIGMTLESMKSTFSTSIHVTPNRIRTDE